MSDKQRVIGRLETILSKVEELKNIELELNIDSGIYHDNIIQDLMQSINELRFKKG